MSENQPSNELRKTKRFITGHNPDGLACFNEEIPETVPAQVIPTGDNLYLEYTTDRFPVDLTRDLETYQNHLIDPPAFTSPGGTLLCTIDLAPGSTSHLHRTLSLDYAVVIEGVVELELDGGESKILQRGDVAVQRGTKHLWRNKSQESWARVIFMLQESLPVEVGGHALNEELGF